MANYVIEHDGERFEGATKQDAEKAMRRHRAQERKRELVIKQLYELAQLRAQACGYRVLAVLAENKPLPPGWSVRRVGEPEFSAHRIEYVPGGYDSIFYARDGKGRWSWPYTDSTKIRGCLENAAGYCIAIFIDADDATAYAPGVAEPSEGDGVETQTCVADLPGVTMDSVIDRLSKQKEGAK